MAFSDYSSTPALNTTIGDAIYIGPNMARNDVRDALQQLAADGRGLLDAVGSAALSGKYYPTIAAGAAATSEPDTFLSDESGTITLYDHAGVEVADLGRDVSFTQSGAGAVARTVQDKARETVSVEDFGATGDGATDDTTAWQNALTAGKNVFAKPGATYLVGALTAATARQKIDLRGAVLKLKANTDAAILTISGADVSVIGGEMDGNRANQAARDSYSAVGIQVTGSGASIDGAYVHDVAGVGIRSIDASRIKITNCRTDRTDLMGIFVNTSASGTVTDVLVSGNTIDRSNDAGRTLHMGGIQIQPDAGGTVSRVRVSDNYCKNEAATTTTITAIGITTRAAFATITGNICEDGYMGISVDGMSLTNEMQSVTGNTIIAPNEYGIELAAVSHCAVSGNTIYGNSVTARGIAINGGNGTAEFNTISGNVIQGCTQYSIAATGFVEAGSSKYTTVTGNNINGPGILMNDCNHSTFSGNVLYGPGSGAAIVAAFKSGSDANTNIAVSGNTVNNYASVFEVTASAAYAASNISITGNANYNVSVLFVVSGSATAGGRIKGRANSRLDDYLDFAGNVREIIATGAPEGVYAAGVGSIFHRSNGGASTTLYIKESGTGNTGWVAK